METLGLGTDADGDDPGWRPAFRDVARVAIPPLAMVRRLVPSQKDQADGLTALRSLFMAFALSLGLVGILVGLLADGSMQPTMSGQSGALLVAVLGAASLLLARLVTRPLDCVSDASLFTSYRSRFFLRLACANAPAYGGFVVFFLTANAAMYPLALAFSAVGYVSLAPTAARLRAEQHELSVNGCQRSLIRAIRSGGRR